MKVISKILILVIAITLAIGGIMSYAKTKVEPPKAIKSINQFSNNLENCYKAFAKKNTPSQQDSIFETTINKINIYIAESKIEKEIGDTNIDKLLSIYTPLFLKRSFDKFHQNVWLESDHKYMLNIVSYIRNIKQTRWDSDKTESDRRQNQEKNDKICVVRGDKPKKRGAIGEGGKINHQTTDSLVLIENIISKYRQARAISTRTGFHGVANAQSTISQARQFANDNYLSNCTDLVSALNKVKPSIAQSHYNYICGMVEKLSQYRSFSQSYYDNTLVPQVDAAVTEYDNKAITLYGSKQNVNPLWDKARSYYNSASQYYNN